jgi:predicted oxidoreductase
VTCGITFTFGGVKVNEKAQVLNSLHNPIKGLYASGDILGLFFPQLSRLHGPDAQRRVRPPRRMHAATDN